MNTMYKMPIIDENTCEKILIVLRKNPACRFLSSNVLHALVYEYEVFMCCHWFMRFKANANGSNYYPIERTSAIDAVWQAHILYTKIYFKFCNLHFGGPLDHDPNIAAGGYMFHHNMHELIRTNSMLKKLIQRPSGSLAVNTARYLAWEDLHIPTVSSTIENYKRVKQEKI